MNVFLPPSMTAAAVAACVAIAVAACLAIAVAACLAIVPATAQGASTTPLSPGLPQSPARTTAPNTSPGPVLTNTSTTSSSGGGLSGSAGIEIAVGAFIVLGGISLFIWRDARRRAPIRGRAVTAAAGGGRSHSGSKARPKPRKPSPAERRRRKRGRAR